MVSMVLNIRRIEISVKMLRIVAWSFLVFHGELTWAQSSFTRESGDTSSLHKSLKQYEFESYRINANLARAIQTARMNNIPVPGTLPRNATKHDVTFKLFTRNDINIIIFDYDEFDLLNEMYDNCIAGPQLADLVVECIRELLDVGSDTKKIDLIGFSLGAQILAQAAKIIEPKVARLLAIDPSGICYDFFPHNQLAAKSDADQVIIIHGSVGRFSTPLNNTGDLTFYLNGGYTQPNCISNITLIDEAALALVNYCSHITCGNSFFDSLLNLHTATRCNTYSEYLQGLCDCGNRITYGFYAHANVTGAYFSDDDSNYPSRNNKNCDNWN